MQLHEIRYKGAWVTIVTIRYADINDLEILKCYDKHIGEEELKQSILRKRVIVAFDKKILGWLRYNLFWDNTPFMNMLYLLEEYRGKGYGKLLIAYFEKEMKKIGYKFVLTSTQSDEKGQFFYRKNGYKDIGSFVLPNEVSEIILYKQI